MYGKNECYAQETSCRTGIGQQKETAMEDFYVCQIKIPPQGQPLHNFLGLKQLNSRIIIDEGRVFSFAISQRLLERIALNVL